ncbi:hypothetical protein M0813_23243 [Anaeramoeba flamelloides]|uniref:Ankyrin repeat protein n=1 Tax=Anaeramoeba flamelloides TaxID=1746091 RepID=A0ABQ8Y9K9_9EUKA|nr:hypothetical protein M0813_23243 [Anaeramoeba flamelloides]
MSRNKRLDRNERLKILKSGNVELIKSTFNRKNILRKLGYGTGENLPIYVAIQNRCDFEIIKYFISLGANLDSPEFYSTDLAYSGPLSIVCRSNPLDLKLLKYLLQHGANPNIGSATRYYYQDSRYTSDRFDGYYPDCSCWSQSKVSPISTLIKTNQKNYFQGIKLLIKYGAVEKTTNLQIKNPEDKELVLECISNDRVLFLSDFKKCNKILETDIKIFGMSLNRSLILLRCGIDPDTFKMIIEENLTEHKFQSVYIYIYILPVRRIRV